MRDECEAQGGDYLSKRRGMGGDEWDTMGLVGLELLRGKIGFR